ncbi:MAG: hypothetical protein JOZ77_07030 [Candidatus Eremiobacteraeota bacterium]|nr:hypothetical protein [Candidatus Eremiobacteraeota bacterium]
MRRVVGVVVGLALAVASSASVALGTPLGSQRDRFDLGSQLMLRLFGETSDSRASFAAARGDRASESPMRELALRVRPAGATTDLAIVGPDFDQERMAFAGSWPDDPPQVGVSPTWSATASSVRFSAPFVATDSAVLVPSGEHFAVAYQPVPPEPVISPAPGTLAFSPAETHVADFLPATTQVDGIQLETKTQETGVPAPQLGLHDATYGARATFDLRAGKRNLDVNLSSEYEQPGSTNLNSLSLTPNVTSLQLPGGSTPLVIPNATDLNRLSLGAGVSVPVVRGLTLNLNYNAQRLYGGYSLPGFLNLDTISNTYGGKLTFTIPRISSSLSIGAYQDRFQDSVLPIAGETQTREDVNFTVKF